MTPWAEKSPGARTAGGSLCQEGRAEARCLRHLDELPGLMRGVPCALPGMKGTYLVHTSFQTEAWLPHQVTQILQIMCPCGPCAPPFNNALDPPPAGQGRQVDLDHASSASVPRVLMTQLQGKETLILLSTSLPLITVVPHGSPVDRQCRREASCRLQETTALTSGALWCPTSLKRQPCGLKARCPRARHPGMSSAEGRSQFYPRDGNNDLKSKLMRPTSGRTSTADYAVCHRDSGAGRRTCATTESIRYWQ